MFADDKSIENFQQLFFEFKKYLELQKEYTKLELTEKLTILLSTLIMIVVLIILGMVALFYLLFALAYVLEPLVGGLIVSFAIIAGIERTHERIRLIGGGRKRSEYLTGGSCHGSFLGMNLVQELLFALSNLF